MIFANHNLNNEFLGILTPAQDEAADTNSIDSITRQTNICSDNYGRVPNVVMVSSLLYMIKVPELVGPGPS